MLSSCFGRLWPRSYEEFLVQVLQTEAEQRKENQRKRRIKAARFPLRTLDTFEFENLEHVKPETVWSLADNGYIKRRENIICMGNPGMGKTHLSIALGILACNDGYRVRFYSAPALANELVEADHQHEPGVLEAGSVFWRSSKAKGYPHYSAIARTAGFSLFPGPSPFAGGPSLAAGKLCRPVKKLTLGPGFDILKATYRGCT
ncbi:MAG TPA: hypothetical protein DCL99_04030 [Firmicutes bacterium]|nr:hypothetical protein [Bacillota bacterium]